MMKFRIMKKFYFALLFLGVLAGFVSSCSDDDGYTSGINPEPPVINPEPPVINPKPPIINITSGNLSMHLGDSIILKAAVTSPTETVFSWTVDTVKVSTDSVYVFKSEYSGSFNVKLSATNTDGTVTTATTITVQPGKYKNGTFVLSENQSLLTFISPEGKVTADAYTDVNGTKLGSVNQDIFICNHKIYIVSQNGGGDGYLVIANAETLKKIKGFQGDLQGKLRNPTHVAVLDDDNVYLRDDGKGVHLFKPSDRSITFIKGTEKARKNAMAVADGKVFVSVAKNVVVIEPNKDEISSTITFDGNVSGVIKASDGNIWVSDASGNITKVDARTYAKLGTNKVSDEAKSVLSASFAAAPSITAKGDTLYMSGLSSKIYRHIFSTQETKLMVDAKALVENVGIVYNTCAVHPLTGEVYLNSIKGYGTDYKINNISVFDFSGDEPKVSVNYQNYTAFPAGTFFTYNFE